MTEVNENEIEKIGLASFISWQKLANRTIFVTGATGLIGYTLTLGLLKASKMHNLDLEVIALVRDLERAKIRFGKWSDGNNLRFVVGNVENLPFIEEKIDYVIHGASQTASKSFIERPVETIATAVLGTANLLELARKKKVKGFAYLSSMEVYGYPSKGHKVKEKEIGALSPLDIRNSYPISKQQCEALCCAYAKEYEVPAKIIRLTQTLGSGVNYNDNRIFAEIGRCIVEKRDIVLKTKGLTERSYLYTIDAATAILNVLLDGKKGEAYNAADESTYCSIFDMASQLAHEYGINVRLDLQDEKAFGYPKTLYMDLDTSKLRGLGWRPENGGVF